MSNLDFIYNRKSIRDYKDAVVPKEDILKMLDAATHAPSPKHQQNWHFVVVQDKEVINKMADAVSMLMLSVTRFLSIKKPTKP